jgi:hypothetical protein
MVVDGGLCASLAVDDLRLSCSKGQKNANIHPSSGAISEFLNLTHNQANKNQTCIEKGEVGAENESGNQSGPLFLPYINCRNRSGESPAIT